jgi:hypothetical protein
MRPIVVAVWLPFVVAAWPAHGKERPDLAGAWIINSVRVVRGSAIDCSVPTTTTRDDARTARSLAPLCADRLAITRSGDSIMIEHISPRTPALQSFVTAFNGNGELATAEGRKPTDFEEVTLYRAKWKDASLAIEQLTATPAPKKARNPITQPTLPTGRTPDPVATELTTWPDASLEYAIDASRSRLTLQIQRGQSRIERLFDREHPTPD